MAAENILIVKDENFADTIENNNLILVDFWADWCGPCKMIAPVIDEIAGLYQGRMAVGKMNVDENRNIPGQYGIMSIPTLVLFKDGEELERIVGYKSKNELVQIIDRHL